ncbi:hypothetical protein QM012_000877 [Aureobasidium pullulans]|uniref:Uncharacterized protein n=1 Tax=Aureobasidium pullulans TaxID=5580 RepID=A0ABR0TF24_AURPU
MEPPPGIAFADELEWLCKEPALVVWNEPGRSEISSLGLPCPTGRPTLLTLWVGKNAAQEVYLMLHLRITIRVSKRRKILDHYLLPSSDTCIAAGTSIVHLKNAPENIRQCLEEAYGKFSTQKCLRIPFCQPMSGRVLMPIAPDNAPCLGGTALHLLTLLHSLSRASSFEIFVGHSTYAQHALTNIEGALADSAKIDLLSSYGGSGGVYDDWRRIDTKQPGPSKAQVDIVPHEACILEHQSTFIQPTCSPPPYSPPPKTARLPETPKNSRVVNERSNPVNTAGCRKRPHALIEPEAAVKSRIISSSSILNDTSEIAHDTEESSSLDQTVCSPTIVNTPSTVEDTHALHAGHLTPNSTKTVPIESDGSFTGHLLSVIRNTSPSILSTPDRSDTLTIKPTIFTNEDELPRYSTDADKVSTQAQDQGNRNIASSFMSTSTSFDTISPKRKLRSLSRELHMLVSAKVPLLTEQALQRTIDDVLESLDYSQKVAELGLQETLDDLKVELQLEKDKGLENIEDHAENTLTDVKCQMEDLAGGHLLAFEDMMQRTGEQLKQTLRTFLLVLAKAVAASKVDHDDRTSNIQKTNTPEAQDQHSSATSDTQPSNTIPSGMADSPAVAATKLFLHESGNLCTSAKVKVLDRLASQNTAEIFLTVDKELREAWVASWTGQVQS